MPHNAANDGWAAKKILNIRCAQMAQTAFFKLFVFLFVFPEIKAKSLSIFIAVDKL